MMEYPRAGVGHKTPKIRQRQRGQAIICDSFSLTLDIPCGSDARYGSNTNLHFIRPTSRRRKGKPGCSAMSTQAMSRHSRTDDWMAEKIGKTASQFGSRSFCSGSIGDLRTLTTDRAQVNIFEERR